MTEEKDKGVWWYLLRLPSHLKTDIKKYSSLHELTYCKWLQKAISNQIELDKIKFKTSK